MSDRLIVGLANPGAKYANTRHNAGEWFINCLLNHNGLVLKKSSICKGETASFSDDFGRCFILVPGTYMNCSGRPVGDIARFYKIKPENIFVAHDELDFSVGVARLKYGGGAGGHNGIKDIIAHVGNDFARLRIGIGRPEIQATDSYVLSKPSAEQRAKINQSIEYAVECFDYWLAGDLQAMMRELH